MKELKIIVNSRGKAKHVLFSMSVCSNVPDYEDPRCFVSDGESKILLASVLSYPSEIRVFCLTHRN